MKFLKKDFIESKEKKEYSFVTLENEMDFRCYKSINEQIRSRESIDFWIGFKSQSGKFVHEPIAYSSHQSNYNPMAAVLALNMEYGEKSVEGKSLVEFCSDSDKIINDVHHNMLRYISEGRIIRINEDGGYCPIDNYDGYKKVVDINEQELHNFLIHKVLNPQFKISSPTVVIENDSYIPDRLVDQFSNLMRIRKDQMQIITSFKIKSILFKEQDYIKFFDDGINAGLKNVVLETTAQDQHQIRGMKKIFEYLMNKHSDKTLNIYVKTNSQNKQFFDTKVKNINVTFLES